MDRRRITFRLPEHLEAKVDKEAAKRGGMTAYLVGLIEADAGGVPKLLRKMEGHLKQLADAVELELDVEA